MALGVGDGPPNPSKKPGVYVSRKVDLRSAEALARWAIRSGIKPVLAPGEMHVTLAYSRKPFTPKLSGKELSVPLQEAKVEPLGEDGALVLRFDSPSLSAEWKAHRDAGASWDHDGFKPHVTLSYEAKVDPKSVSLRSLPVALTFSAPRKAPIDENFGGKVRHVTSVKPVSGIGLGR